MITCEERKNRLLKANNLMKRLNLNSILVVGNGSVATNEYGFYRYFVDNRVYYHRQALVIVADETPTVCCGSLTHLKALNERGFWDVRMVGDRLAEGLVDILGSRGITNGRIGYCPETLPASWFDCIHSAYPELEWVDCTMDLYEIRKKRSSEECRLVEKCAELALSGYEALCAAVQNNVTESKLVSELDYARGFSKKFKMITSPKPTGKELWKAFVDAIWALLMPVIILGGIYGGYFTPTEAAAVAVVYGLIIGLFVYRELKWKDIPKTFVNAARTSAAVMMIIVTAATFAIVLTRNNIPTLIGNWIIGIAKTPLMFYGLFSIFMFFLGMFMSVSPALVILTPILAPAATVIGIDPVHFGVVFVVWMCIGTITPPFGSDLFIACGVAKISAASAFKRIWPFVIIYVAVVVLIMAFPDLVTFLPKLLKLM